MKTKLSFGTALAFLFAVAMVASDAYAQTSPVGTWEVLFSAPSKGLGRFTFNANNTFTGYGLTAGSGEVFEVEGNWGFDDMGNVAATFGGTGQFTARVKPGGTAIAGRGVTNGGNPLAFKGAPAAEGPNLAGTWNATGRGFTETWTITATGSPGLFDVTGNGMAGKTTWTLEGQILANSRGVIGATINYVENQTTDLHAMLAGKFNARTGAMAFKGVEDDGTKFAEVLTRQN